MRVTSREIWSSSDTKQGAAWLSSARAVRCWVKSRNERNPCVYLPARNGGNSKQTACENKRKVGMTSSQYGPYVQGCTRATMGSTIGSNIVRWSKSLKLPSVRIEV